MKKKLLLIALPLATAAALPLLRRERVAPPPEILRSPPAAARQAAPTSSLEVQLLAAESTYWRGEYDSARAAWTHLLRTSALATDSGAVAEVKTWLGLAAWRLGDYQAARAHGEFALALKQRLGLESALPRSYNALGLLAWNEGRLTEASHLFETGLTVAKRVNDVVSAVKFANNIGLVETEFARLDRAHIQFTRSRELARQAGETRLEGNALTNLGMLDVRMGDASGAIEKLMEARRLYAQVDYSTGEQNALGQLTTAYALQGDLRRAFATLDSATEIAAREDLKQDVASNLEIMADLYREAGDVRKALQYYERAQKLNQELGLAVERGSVMRRIAELHFALGAPAAASAAVASAALIHQEASAPADELKDRLLMAQLDPGSTALARAADLARLIDTPDARAALALTRARLWFDRAEPARALELLTGAHFARAGFDLESRAAVLRAAALAQIGAKTDAHAASLDALESLERMRASLPSGMLRASFSAQRTDLYEMLIDAQLQLGLTSEAFATSEHARGDAGSLADKNTAAIAALRRVRALSDTVNVLNAVVANGDASERVHRDELERALNEARHDYESLLARSPTRSARHAAPPLHELQAVLRPDEVLLEYFVGRSAVYGFAISRAEVRAQKLGVSASALIAKTRMARASLQARDPSGAATLTSLYDQLIRPFRISVPRIVVVPHGSLSYLPFAALRESPNGRYLVENAALEFVASGNQLVRLRRQEPLAHKPTALVFQPFPEQLPGTRAEAQVVKRAWRGTVVYRKQHASVSELNAALASTSIVHVASHGAMDPQAPLFSYVSLAGESRGDQRFEIHDVIARRVRAPLVFLSGCETGLGAASATGYQTGDDASTFAQALLGAGSRAVVSTVWRIEDRSAAVLSERFYQNMQREDAALALAHAQRSLLRSRRYGAPFYWAAYMLTGEVDFTGREVAAAD